MAIWGHEEDREIARRFWQEIIGCQSPAAVSYRVLRWDGAWRWLEVSSVPVRDLQGKITGCAGVVTDITERVQAEEASRKTEALRVAARYTRSLIEACRKLGGMFALDDFGAGYFSLAYLKRLPVKQLKIDQSFVSDMLNDPDDLSILEGVLSLTIAFRREVIAEGVETVAHGAMLLQLSCDLAQGYGIAHPMPTGELPDWIASWHTDPSCENLAAVAHADLPLLAGRLDRTVEDGHRNSLALCHLRRRGRLVKRK